MFFTRWVTHICAPTFFLLMGAGAFLAGRTKPAGELSRYLLWRGVWLIALEIVVVRCLGLQFNVDYRTTMVNVLWALGWSMIALAGLVHLPAVAVGTVGVVTIVAHNLFDGVRASTFGMFAPLWTVLHGQGVIVSSPRFVVFAAYPLIPWVGVAAAGYALCRSVHLACAEARRCAVAAWPRLRGRVRRAARAQCLRRPRAVGGPDYPRHGRPCRF